MAFTSLKVTLSIFKDFHREIKKLTQTVCFIIPNRAFVQGMCLFQFPTLLSNCLRRNVLM